jgi:hypothetical protein
MPKTRSSAVQPKVALVPEISTTRLSTSIAFTR